MATPHHRGRGRAHSRARRSYEFTIADDPIYRDRDGAISRYKEWVDHRYDPGYYLGGRLPPLTRVLQGDTPGAAVYGAVLLAAGLISLLWIAVTLPDAGLDGGLITTGFEILFSLLTFTAGLVAVRRARRHRSAETKPRAR